MMRTIENMEIGPRMVQWMKTLYNHPTALVKVNRSLSPPFEMFSGARQRCLISSLLFVLLLEQFLTTIQNSANIGRVKIGDEKQKVAAYADDVLFYVSNPRTTLPTLKNYRELSNLRINPVKSEILNNKYR